jgi:MFS family permease
VIAALRVPVEASRKRLHTFRALRHRNYRLYWLGMVVAITGLQVQTVAQGWLVYELTNSTALLGAVGLAQAVPTIILTLFGGVVADRVDRQRLITFTQMLNAAVLFVLAILVATDRVEIWHIVVCAFLIGSISAFDQPARMALTPHLVAREDLMSAIAMTSMVWQSTRIIGPAVAGVLIAQVGIEACFFLTAAGYAVMVLAIMAIRIPRIPPPPGRANVVRDLGTGVRYIAGNPVFSTLIGLTFFNSLFGMSYVTMMPVFARDVLETGPTGYGSLMGASGLGALIGTVLIASLGAGAPRGKLLLGGAVGFGVLIVGLALSRLYPVSIAIMFGMGAVNSMYMTSVNTTLQALVEDEVRGRVMSIYSMTWSLMPLGGFLSGAIAQRFSDPATGAPFAVGLGGALVALMALFVAVQVPRVRRL